MMFRPFIRPAPIITLAPNHPDDRVAGMRDVLSFLDTVREESRQWREKNPDRVRFEQAFRDGQWEAINLACTTIENRIAELEADNG